MFKKTSTLFRFVAHHWLTLGFVLGFITDMILLNRIDDLVDNLILLFYVLLATTAMLLLYVGVAERAPSFLSNFFKKYSPILMQYAFGGLLSGMLIFYGRSGDWLASAPFLLLILGVILGNEFVGKRSDRLVYNLALYFIGLFSYVVLVIPVLTGLMGDWVFVVSGIIALMMVTFVIRILHWIVPNFMEANVGRVILVIGFIYIGFNTLYFTSLIPPIPLSLTDLEIVQSVNRLESGGYRVVTELQPWYRSIPFIHPVIHPTGNSIACFARVYAPTKLSTKIYHRWEYKDEAGVWRQHFRFGYDISGINKGGYGGYTVADSFFSGVWRCSVETERGQVLGREVVVINTKEKVGETQIQIR
ncbi:DUF2914 domain-containing protein [Candidatus Nomurabacteria bacterium]|nr:DUF2914 domain-containing protein [Candidatus Kaiserbacteria bacterium]MCB9810366.1 DUF2914 domain-containing protein [Candidatus Nomurabacteria bacterium]MCB9818052.1 DUF2914 domain-containing protein [Candidatus Nomurabacteria bacterium]